VCGVTLDSALLMTTFAVLTASRTSECQVEEGKDAESTGEGVYLYFATQRPT
jgi:hypothetical protein